MQRRHFCPDRPKPCGPSYGLRQRRMDECKGEDQPSSHGKLTQSCLRGRPQSCGQILSEGPGCAASAPAHAGLFVPAAEMLGAAVPHRGQWLQSGSSDILQAGQGLSAVAVTVEGPSGLGGSSSPASDTPFLNSFIDFPSDAASSGSFFAPKRTRTITRPTSRSWEPIIAVPPSGSPTSYASAQRMVAKVLGPPDLEHEHRPEGLAVVPRAALVLGD